MYELVIINLCQCFIILALMMVLCVLCYIHGRREGYRQGRRDGYEQKLVRDKKVEEHEKVNWITLER